MKSLLAVGRERHMQVLLPVFQSGEGPIDFRSSSRRESGVPRPLESEKTFLLVQVKLRKASQEMETLAPLFRSVVCFSFLFLPFLPCYFLPPFFFLIPFIPRSDLSRCLTYSTGIERGYFCCFYRKLPKRGSARTVR